MFSVTISEKGGQQSQYDFTKPEITIGRMKGNDIVLPKGNVSKQHTRIFLREQNFFIVDLKSTNGTYVNGRKVTNEQPITESDKIYIGDFILQLQRQTAQQSQEGPPKPPSPPKPNAGPGAGNQGGGQSGGGGGRHFPTVMDGAQDRDSGPSAPAQNNQGLGSPSSPGNPAQTNPPSPAPQNQPEPPSPGPKNQPSPAPNASPQRSSSSPGNPSAGGPTGPQSPAPTPNTPSGGNDLRKTLGESAPEIELTPEPVEEAPDVGSSPGGSAPSPSPSPGPDRSPSSPAQRQPTPVPNAGEPSPPPVVSQPSAHGASTLAAKSSLEDEFDEDFHRAQQDVARVFFENMAVSELPLDYPLTDGAAETRIANAVDQAVTTVAPGVDKQKLKDLVTKEATGLGALEDYLDDESVHAIYVNAYDRLLIRREGQLVIGERAYSHPDMLDLAARRLLGPHETVPVSDEVRFSDGTRVHIVMPPLAVNGPALTIQKPNQYFPDLGELAAKGSMSTGMAEFLERAVEAGRSMVIAGPTNSGKSTLMAALTKAVPQSSRLIAIEQHSNLPLDEPNFIGLEASPTSGFDLRFLIQNAVAMHPQRILVDECRGAEAYDWVTAATSGTEGSMVTLHGSSAANALGRLESMCLLAANDISPRGLREQVAHSVDLVVVLNSRPDGGFRVQQIAEVQGVDLDSFRLNDIFYYRVEGTAGDFHPTGYIPLFYEDLRHAGFDVDLGIFRE